MMNTLTRYRACANAGFMTILPCIKTSICVKTGMRNPIRRDHRVPANRSGVFNQRKNVKMLNRNSSLLSDLKNCFFSHKAASSLLALGLLLAPATMHSAFAEILANQNVEWSGRYGLPPGTSCAITLGREGKLGFDESGINISSDAANTDSLGASGQTAQLTVSANSPGNVKLALVASRPSIIRDGNDVSKKEFVKIRQAGFGTTAGTNVGGYTTSSSTYAMPLESKETDRVVDVWFWGVYHPLGTLPDGVYKAKSTITCDIDVEMKETPLQGDE